MLLNVLQLGRWELATISDAEDALLKPHLQPIPANMAKVLSSHLEEFHALMGKDSAKLRRLQHSIPCYSVLKQAKQLKQITSPDLVQLVGIQQLSLSDFRALLHWFEKFGPQTLEGRSAGLQQGAAWVHGVTIVLAMQSQQNLEDAFQQLLQNELAQHPANTFAMTLDAVQVLERALFSQTSDSGDAGLQQWGLDVGKHQDGWDPYEESNDPDWFSDWFDNSTERRLRRRGQVSHLLLIVQQIYAFVYFIFLQPGPNFESDVSIDVD